MPQDPLYTSRQPHLICLAITVLTLLIYGQVSDHAFLDYDDNVYISANPHIADGVTLRGLIWAFTSVYESNWIPLTWISHMVDVELFGVAASGHHLINVALHLINSLLLFFLFRKMTAALWRPALLALLFAVHPLHVESVAWASERKDLLCGLFYLLALFFYASYVKKRQREKYLLALAAFVLGALTKPMAVTLPCALMLIDFWPLQRSHHSAGNLRLVLIDKMPFLRGDCRGSHI